MSVIFDTANQMYNSFMSTGTVPSSPTSNALDNLASNLDTLEKRLAQFNDLSSYLKAFGYDEDLIQVNDTRIQKLKSHIENIKTASKSRARAVSKDIPESTDPKSETIETPVRGDATLGDLKRQVNPYVNRIKPIALTKTSSNLSKVQMAHANYIKELGRFNTQFASSSVSIPKADIETELTKNALIAEGYTDLKTRAL